MILVDTILGEAARALSDAGRGKIGTTELLLWYNEAIEHMSLTWKILEEDSTHPIDANEDRYLYPDLMVQMQRWRYSETPTDPLSYTKGREIFEDEFTAATNRSMPTGDQEFRYWARAQFFQITPRPTLTVAAGGLITYWKLAGRVIDPLTEVFELPAGVRVFVRRRIVMEAKLRLHRYEEYATDLAVWERDVDKVADRFEDRSDDRRPRLRLRTARVGVSRYN